MLGFFAFLRRAVGRFVASRFAFHAVVAVLLFVPHLFGSRDSPAPWHFGIPRIHSGDEPHYLVHVHSIVDDHDLDLGNQYLKVHKGSMDAGFLVRGADLNHHSVWFVDGKRVHWAEVFKRVPPWDKDADGHWVPTVRPGVDPKLLPKGEVPWNSPGLPLLLSPFFFAVKGLGYGAWIEPAATFLSAFMILIASLFWRMLAGVFTKDRAIINIGVALAFLGTPAWHYGRSFFGEPYILCFVTAAYALMLRRDHALLPGFLIGMAIFVKPVALLMGIPLGIVFLLRGQIGAVVKFSIPVVIWVALVLVENTILYGGPFNTSNEFKPGAPLYNAIQVLGHPVRGLLSTAPIVVLALAGWPRLVEQSRAAFGVVASFTIFFAMCAFNHAWSGGYAYSIRFLVPLMPLFALGVIPLLKGNHRRFVLFIGALSMCVNLLAAVQYWRAFHNHPFLYLVPSTEWDAVQTA